MSSIPASIVICTHNPDDILFSRCLEAIAGLHWPAGSEPEIVIVDNRSEIPLAQVSWVSEWLGRTRGARLVREDNLGLSFARSRGFREVGGELIICFDDDNVPMPSYVEASLEASLSHPFVGVWGPGHITVEWLDGGDPDVISGFAHQFQQHHQDVITYGLDFPKPRSMPYGTGMVIRRAVADNYSTRVTEGSLETTGRRGQSLVSAEDNQISWLAMCDGWAVGRHPSLRLSHLIPGARARMPYVARLIFYKACSSAPAMREVLPEKYRHAPPRAAKLAAKLTGKSLKWLCTSKRQSLGVMLARAFGEAVGEWRACDRTPPWWVRKLTRYFYDA